MLLVNFSIPTKNIPIIFPSYSQRWLVVWNMNGLWLSIQLGMSSSQLTNSYFSEGWLNHQSDHCPTKSTKKIQVSLHLSHLSHYTHINTHRYTHRYSNYIYSNYIFPSYSQLTSRLFLDLRCADSQAFAPQFRRAAELVELREPTLGAMGSLVTGIWG